MITLRLLRYPVRFILSARAAVAGSSRRTNLQVTLLSSFCITLLNIIPLNASSKSVDLYKLYAHLSIISASEYKCLDTLWTAESNWNPLSKNKKSSAMGIPQLLRLTTKDPFEQIDLGLKYIKARHLTPCNALSFFLKSGHY